MKVSLTISKSGQQLRKPIVVDCIKNGDINRAHFQIPHHWQPGAFDVISVIVLPEIARCQWVYNYMTEDGVYETSCGHSFFFDSGDVKENNFKYCPFCGKEIEPVEPPLEIEDDD